MSAGSQMPCGSAELHYLTELNGDRNRHDIHCVHCTNCEPSHEYQVPSELL